MEAIPTLTLLLSLSSISVITNSEDTITTTQFITGNETIVSSGGMFEMGFFSPGSSKNRYVGIWYKNIPIQTVVWVANREVPITDEISGVLKMIDSLVLLNGNNTVIWSTNTTNSGVQGPVAKLLDTGNLVVKGAADDDDVPENFLWQSFDYPCDTLLPGMKHGKDFLTGHERYLSSWKSSDDPAPGDYTYRFDFNGYPQIILRKNSDPFFRTGPWNGISFSGTPNLKKNPIYKFGFVLNKKESYYSYELLNNTTISRFMVNYTGYVQRWIWVDSTHSWSLYLTVPNDICDNYGPCGAYGSCNNGNSPRCGCLSRFVEKDPSKWKLAEWSSGCARRVALNCSKGDAFLPYSQLKLPDTRSSWFNESMNLKECETVCSKNCSCMAYASLDVRNGGSGCLLWFGDLLDVSDIATNVEDIYIRMASSELENSAVQVGSKKERVIVGLMISIGALLLSLGIALYIWKKKKKNMLRHEEERRLANNYDQGNTSEYHNEDLELPLFGLATIVDATDNFSINNKLGEGGYGPVYKGMLEGGQEIAVKRLSKSSCQGLDQFKNEVICIAKLQHRNLVKLIGCCIQGEERMLIYEYMHNKSLDFWIYGKPQHMVLDWPKRLNIINGIARGIMYLHQDSRLRIIHRDLKASNILLDANMNPKISDFGMARRFGGNETEAQTVRVVGTYGYMSPEYAVDGLFSVKSDVYSFGVLVLEIVSGRRNRGFCHPDHYHNLLGHAWILHKEGREMKLVDDAYKGESCCLSEVMRSIHVGLLCVQQYPDDRPNMSSVVMMLGSEGSLPPPKHPGFFFTERKIVEADSSSSNQVLYSENYLSITALEPR